MPNISEAARGPEKQDSRPNDNLEAVMDPVIQGGVCVPCGKNPGNTTRGSENVVVGDQPGLSNFVNRSVIPRSEYQSCHTEA
jgi:hypothetical protein